MKTILLPSLLCVLALGAAAPVQADPVRGAIIGGVAGGIIGHQSKEGLAGAAIGAVAGGLVGHAVSERREHRATVTYVRHHPRPVVCAAPPPVVVVRPVAHPRYHPRTVVVVRETPRPVVVVQRPAPRQIVIAADDACVTDIHGYSSADYLALLRPSEVQILRQRAYGDHYADYAVFLTEQEKANLRARAARQVEIGA